MKIKKKFVISRDKKNYIYVEKYVKNSSLDFEKIKYLVFLDEMTREVLSPNDFSLIYCNDDKYSIKNFIIMAENELLDPYEFWNDNEVINKKKYILQQFNEVKKSFTGKFRKESELNPSLWGCKNAFLLGIHEYNKLALKRNNENDLDYEREFDRLNDEDIEDILERVRKIEI